MSDPNDREGIIDGSFVRKSFYIEPPGPDADPAAWEAWHKADALAARAAKAQHTKSLRHEEIPEYLQAKVVSKVGGVYRQSVNVGFVGSADDGTLGVEPAIEADQERSIALIGMEAARRKHQPRKSASERRKAKRKARRS